MINRVIWTCWFQGLDRAPELVQRAITSWWLRNPTWELRCLDAESIRRYVDIDDHIDLSRQQLTAASLSDVVRLLLLHEYGGVWVDATTVCNRSLDDWLAPAAAQGFFAFDRPAPDRPVASWFLAAQAGNPLLAKWAARALEYWQGRERSDDYFWVHHLFANLLKEDQGANRDWARVPKISADGPHSVQWAGMSQPFYNVCERIDWGAPVFKLTHRIEPGALISPALANHVLPSANAAARFQIERTELSNDPPPVAAMAKLKVSTENLGDHIQIIAAERLCRAFSSSAAAMEIDRDDEIASAPALDGVEHDVGILLNGWFKTNPAEWPPHPRLRPLYIGFHIRLFQSPSLIGPEAIQHYRAAGPIGCRDRYTFNLLRTHGVDAYLSNCLSLSLPRRLPNPEQQTETFIVSKDERILQYLPRELAKHATFLSHYSGDRDHAANMERARALLDLYRTRAKLIVTTMLHSALPAIAMGIPVVVIYPTNEGPQHASDRERFTALEDLVPLHDPKDLSAVDWSGTTPPVEQIKLSIVDKMAAHSRRWGKLPSRALAPIAPSDVLPVPS